jgi:hypothetical protein
LGTFLVANGGRSRQRCQIGARRCARVLQRHSAGSHSPGGRDPPDQPETRTTLGLIQSRSPGPPARHPASAKQVDDVGAARSAGTSKKPTVAGPRTPSTERLLISQLSTARGYRNRSRRPLCHLLQAGNSSGRLPRETAVPQAAPGTRCDESPVLASLVRQRIPYGEGSHVPRAGQAALNCQLPRPFHSQRTPVHAYRLLLAGAVPVR